MELRELVDQIEDFDRSSARDKIKIFAWYLHTHREKLVVDNALLRVCFEDLHLVDPNVSKYTSRMLEYGDIIKVNGGFKLDRRVRKILDQKYGTHYSIVAVSRLLSELPSKVPNIEQREFLREALTCYRVEAYRSCIAMTWNLAYAHLLDWILRDSARLVIFNASIAKRYPKKGSIVISKYDEFLDEFKEREVIEICNSGALFNANIFKILKEKLDRRNIVTHPTSIEVVQSQADDVVTDLVHNVILMLV